MLLTVVLKLLSFSKPNLRISEENFNVSRFSSKNFLLGETKLINRNFEFDSMFSNKLFLKSDFLFVNYGLM